jgi:hypothetical protein
MPFGMGSLVPSMADVCFLLPHTPHRHTPGPTVAVGLVSRRQPPRSDDGTRRASVTFTQRLGDQLLGCMEANCRELCLTLAPCWESTP